MVDEPEPIQVAAVIALAPDGRCLMCRRVDTGQWAFPAGHVEPGETLEQAAIREFFEECGFWLTAVRPLMRRIRDDGAGLIDCVTFTALVDRPFEPTLNEEHDQFLWLLPEEAIASSNALEPGADLEQAILDKLDDLEARTAKVEGALA
jgi:8-oxo-dGTP pyrophosphatase MutT (NUDIX family)